jgi:hypothetical protein
LEKKVGLIVDGNWFLSEFGNLLDNNYRHVETIGDVKIYKAK